MTLVELSALAGVGTAFGALGLYVIRAELRGDVTRIDGRINTHEAICGERYKTLVEKQDDINKKLDRLLERHT